MGPGTAGSQLAQPVFQTLENSTSLEAQRAFAQSQNVASGSSLYFVGKETETQKKKVIASGHWAISKTTFYIFTPQRL